VADTVAPDFSESNDSLRAWFLGPRAENADLLERLIVEALRDHVFWRRNYHPEDGFTIRETDKRTHGYEEAVSTLTQELMGLLAELKRGVPFFSGRYRAHMLSEQTIAAQVGFFATMLYNPNNVSVEASPVTSRLELEVAAQLAGMIGYDPAKSWGHLTSGGTVANFEALWIARNVFYLPLAAAGAARDLHVDLTVTRPDGTSAPLESLALQQLLNIRTSDALELWDRLWKSDSHQRVTWGACEPFALHGRLPGLRTPPCAGLWRSSASQRHSRRIHGALFVGEDHSCARHRIQPDHPYSGRQLLSSRHDRAVGSDPHAHRTTRSNHGVHHSLRHDRGISGRSARRSSRGARESRGRARRYISRAL
jgi:hypothetical protein